jgi:hypothetical protein
MFSPLLTPAEMEIILSYTFRAHYYRKKSTDTSWIGCRVDPILGAGDFKKTETSRIFPQIET